jgi:DNA-binding phage protein
MTNAAKKVVTKDDRLMIIVKAMIHAKLPSTFIFEASNLARQDNSILELMELWVDETEKEERGEIIADLQDHIDDVKELPKGGPVEAPKISFETLDFVVKDIATFKAKLKDLIDKQGGTVAVAKKVGMPQPSLSRLLNSGSMPRRSTLYKIARALNLSENDIATEWTK